MKPAGEAVLKFWFEGLVRLGELAVYPVRRWGAMTSSRRVTPARGTRR